MPLPLLREELAGGYFRGPTNWARCHVSRLDQPDQDGNEYRLVLALDTGLMDFIEDEAYLGLAGGRAQRPDILAAVAARSAGLVRARALDQGLVPGDLQGTGGARRAPPRRFPPYAAPDTR